MRGQTIEKMENEMVETLKSLIALPAVHPDSGGEGEMKKAEYLNKLIENFGFDSVERYDAEGRPNIVARINGKTNRTIWAVTHMDVVPAGDLKLWETNPFEPVVKDGKIYGRGAEDNGQEIVASLYAAKAVIDEKIEPENNMCLAFVSDEETGSRYGIFHLLSKKLFKKDDYIIVPDGGNESGTLIEVAEKTVLWLKIKTTGKQCHASMPEKGVNAFRAATLLGYKLEELYSKFNIKDPLFSPAISTFEPTKKESNVPNVNTIPGSDVFYLDCRILPNYKTEEVIEFIERRAKDVEKETGAKIEIEVVNREESTRTSPDAPVVKKLKKAVEDVYHIKPYPGGIGGGTCAALFRKQGFDAVVWGKIDDTCHMPNEYCRIENMVNDAKVYGKIFSE
ncbi:MAG: M20 family metallo-hydrolase [Candidatus Thermoplasmatota archaeon]|nr:M20 family metallo-hydrolase [Candidatus Thermoplasmatota archaeon]